jgi:uncharacterized protein
MYPSRFATISERNGQFVVCQTRTGAVAAFSPKLVQLFRAKNATEFSLNDRIQLLRNGFLVKDPDRELDELIEDFKTRKKTRTALHLIVVPGYACNCACPTCFQKDYDKSYRMDSSVCDAIVDFARKRIQQEKHVSAIIWYYGGEPYVHTDICMRLVRDIGKVCQEFSIPNTYRITTNGTRLATRDGQTLSREMNHFYVSIAQSREVQKTQVCYHGGANTYDDVIKGLAEIAKLNKDVTLRVNVSTFDSLEQDMKTLFDDFAKCFGGADYPKIHFEFHVRAETGAHCVGDYKVAKILSQRNKDLVARVAELIPVTGWPRDRFHLPPENKLLSYCNGGCEIELCRFLRGNGFFIAPQGDMYMCNIVENNPTYRIGSIFESDVALQHPVYQLATTKMVSDDAACRECSYLPLCMANCPLGVDDCAGAASRTACREKQKKQVEAYAWHVIQSKGKVDVAP